MKSAYDQNYCIHSNQILHNTEENKVIIMGGPNTPPTNSKLQTAAILKTVISPYVSNRLPDLDKIRPGDADVDSLNRKLS